MVNVIFRLLIISLLSVTSEADSIELRFARDEIHYLAASSIERGYFDPADEDFKYCLKTIMKKRAHKICAYWKYGPMISFRTREVPGKDVLLAKVISRSSDAENILVEETRPFETKPPWRFAMNDSKYVGNCLWNMGHVVSACSFISFLSYWSYFRGIPTLLMPLWAIGSQVLTICSRPIERRDPQIIDAETASIRRIQGKKIEKIYVKAIDTDFNDDWIDPELRHRARIPHEVFTAIECSADVHHVGGYQN